MDIWSLRCLEALAREGNVSNAAKSLHITQPTLSRQLASLEEELGGGLFTRTYKGIGLDERGTLLLNYADAIFDLVEKATSELSLKDDSISGTVYIGAGETTNMTYIAQAMKSVRANHPGIDFQLRSGDSLDLMSNFARGAYDFLVECEVKAHVDCNVMELPIKDRWGAFVLRESALAEAGRVRPEDLVGVPLILPHQATEHGILEQWAWGHMEDYEVVMEFNLPLNASLLCREGIGVQLGYKGVFVSAHDDALTFVPLEPELVSTQGILWRKGRLSKQAAVFLGSLRDAIDRASKDGS